jgi:hypothetical protein
LFELLKPRLEGIYIGQNDYLEIQYGIIGPKANIKEFDAFFEKQAASAEDKEYFKFFGLNISKNLSKAQAKKLISEHKKSCSPDELNEWFEFNFIHSEFEDIDFRRENDLKKVSKATLNEALNKLKQEGKIYSYMPDNIDEVADLIKMLKPELEKFYE